MEFHRLQTRRRGVHSISTRARMGSKSSGGIEDMEYARPTLGSEPTARVSLNEDVGPTSPLASSSFSTLASMNHRAFSTFLTFFSLAIVRIAFCSARRFSRREISTKMDSSIARNSTSSCSIHISAVALTDATQLDNGTAAKGALGMVSFRWAGWMALTDCGLLKLTRVRSNSELALTLDGSGVAALIFVAEALFCSKSDSGPCGGLF